MKKIFAIIVAILLVLSAFAAEPTFNLATYNLRNDNNQEDAKAGDGWQRREPVIAKLIRFHQFDIFGTQEGFKHQLDQLRDSLPGYEYIGVGRDDGKDAGEHSAIFYNTELFDVVDHGDFWLSEHPEKPGLGWDAVCVRICTWGHFRHKPSGREFLYFNLHMDHVGTVARAESARLIRKKIKEFGSDLPTFLSGDFNVDQTSDSYACVLEDGTFRDSFDVADLTFAPNGTYNAFRTDGFTPSRIDHIFVTPGIKISRYGILTDTYRTLDGTEQAVSAGAAPAELKMTKVTPRTPSDHFPVLVTATLPTK